MLWFLVKITSGHSGDVIPRTSGHAGAVIHGSHIEHADVVILHAHLSRWRVGPPVPTPGQPRVMIPFHDDVTKWKHFPRYWPFVRGSTGYGSFVRGIHWLLALCEGNLPVIGGFPSQRASDAELWDKWVIGFSWFRHWTRRRLECFTQFKFCSTGLWSHRLVPYCRVCE